jgi:hypothetical protein
MGLKRPGRVCAHPAERVMDVQCGASGPHRIVIMRTGCAEERHHGVTNVLVDRTAISHNDSIDEGGKAGHQFADLFRIQRSRHCRESTEISEQYGDLSALPSRRAVVLSWTRRGRHIPLCNCGQKSLTMTQRTDAEFFQVPVSEIANNREINVVFSEGRCRIERGPKLPAISQHPSLMSNKPGLDS